MCGFIAVPDAPLSCGGASLDSAYSEFTALHEDRKRRHTHIGLEAILGVHGHASGGTEILTPTLLIRSQARCRCFIHLLACYARIV